MWGINSRTTTTSLETLSYHRRTTGSDLTVQNAESWGLRDSSATIKLHDKSHLMHHLSVGFGVADMHLEGECLCITPSKIVD